jgi:hypothetical protein
MHSDRCFSWAGRPVKASVVAGTGLLLIAPLLTVVVLRLAKPGPRARQTSTTYTTASRKQLRPTAALQDLGQVLSSRGACAESP